MNSKLIDHAAEHRSAWGVPSFLYHLIGALSVHDPKFLEEAARDFLRAADRPFLEAHDAQEAAEKKSQKDVRLGTSSR